MIFGFLIKPKGFANPQANIYIYFTSGAMTEKGLKRKLTAILRADVEWEGS